MFFIQITIMSYNILYWNERDAKWLPTGSNNIPDVDTARTRMRAMAEQCGHCVSFKLEEVDVLATLTDFEYECATTPV